MLSETATPPVQSSACPDAHLVATSQIPCVSFVAGILLGAFLFTMKPVDVNTTLGLRAQLREQYKTFVPEVASTAKNFAKIGGLYSFSECIIDRVRYT